MQVKFDFFAELMNDFFYFVHLKYKYKVISTHAIRIFNRQLMSDFNVLLVVMCMNVSSSTRVMIFDI